MPYDNEPRTDFERAYREEACRTLYNPCHTDTYRGYHDVWEDKISWREKTEFMEGTLLSVGFCKKSRCRFSGWYGCAKKEGSYRYAECYDDQKRKKKITPKDEREIRKIRVLRVMGDICYKCPQGNGYLRACPEDVEHMIPCWRQLKRKKIEAKKKS